jgi:hypothetical protein
MSSTSTPIENHRLSAILDSLPAETSGRIAKERRTHERHKIDRPVAATLFQSPGKPKLELHLCDVSVTGAGLMSKRTFQAGEPFVMALYVAGAGSKLVLCEVRSCKYSTKGLYRVGVEFMASHPDPDKIGKIPLIWSRRYSAG